MSGFSIALQLFSVRDFLLDDIDATFAAIVDAGFSKVEGFALTDHADGYASAMARHGVTMPSAHSAFAFLPACEQRAIFDCARGLGVQTLVESRIPAELFASEAAIAEAAARLNRAAEHASSFGLTVGHHSGIPQFASRVGDDYPEIAFARRLDPEIVIEVDTYWASVAGADPVEAVAQLGSRVRLVHLQDGIGIVEDEDQVALGSGRMPIDEILRAARYLETGVVEFTTYPAEQDLFAALGRSVGYLRTIGGVR